MSRLTELMHLLQSGTLTASESEELEVLLLEQDPTEAREYLASSFALAQQAQPLEQQKAASMLEAILAQDARQLVRRLPAKQRSWLRYAAAAVLLLAIGGAVLWRAGGKRTDDRSQITAKHAIQPGGNKATLTLADGRIIVLDSTANGVLAEQNGIKIINLANGQLSYNKSGIEKSNIEKSYNTLTTPRGGQYQVVLPDGTRVWLNAASSITYPTVFSENARIVTVTGEAYLEVEKDAARPFSVRTKGQQVAVLGTSFNINAYENETSTRTTLLEGSISIVPDSAVIYHLSSVTLKPGQQAGLTATGFNVQQADTEAVLAWKNGLFHFSSAGIEDIMRQVARWYDIEVVYEGKITTDRFSGKVARSANISEVLKVLQESGVRFKIENQKIIVLS
jgi:ferric-dicitrate binding protein FerR (iron transport regulator)